MIRTTNGGTRSLFKCIFLGLVALSAALAGPGAARAADGKGRPNLLLAISDDQSWPYAGAYGCKSVHTPAFDRIAREGVLFTHAYCASPGCSPSRAALLTGRHTWQLEQAGTHASSFPTRYVVYPDQLESAGYYVGLTGKGWGPGNYQVSGRPRNPAGPAFSARTLKSAPRGMSTNDYAANFKDFLAKKPKEKPFCFWYGCTEPHRAFDKGAGLKAGKKLEDALVPPFLPDTPEIRSDLLDYCVEIERFDRDLGEMLRLLEAAGELDNTLVVVTSDNGMPFPRAKANVYEHGTHLPLAVRWPARVKGGRVIDDFVSFIDFAPTFLEAASVQPAAAMTGKSFLHLLTADKQGRLDPARDRIFTARERHSSARPDNLGYPCRALRTYEYLYIRNFAPDRWPAGDPRGAGGDAAGYYDIDGSPSKTFLIEHRDSKEYGRFFQLAVAKRPAEELYDVKKDPANLVNLADRPEYAAVKQRLRGELEQYLKATQDPRVLGNGDVFETYPRYSPIRKFE
jgi:uncharacterized sulfatase